jgi:hypothetical protein
MSFNIVSRNRYGFLRLLKAGGPDQRRFYDLVVFSEKKRVEKLRCVFGRA